MRAALAPALVALLAFPPQDAGTGTVEGTVSLPEKPAPRPRPNRYPGARAPAEYMRGPAVVFLDGVPGAFELPREKVVMEQSARQFRPLALPVLRGTTVSFPNRDDEYHNVFSRSRAKELELGRYGKDDAREVTFDRPGLVRLRCEIHSNMHAVVLVLENLCFAVCDDQGRFTIRDVPPGTYRIHAFHEEVEPKDEKADPLRAVGKAVEVRKGETARVEFDLRK